MFYSPCHESAFTKDGGAWIKGPAPRGMDPLPLEINHGRIRVAYMGAAQIRHRYEGACAVTASAVSIRAVLA